MFNETDPAIGIPEVFIRFGWFIGISIVVLALVVILIRTVGWRKPSRGSRVEGAASSANREPGDSGSVKTHWRPRP